MLISSSHAFKFESIKTSIPKMWNGRPLNVESFSLFGNLGQEYKSTKLAKADMVVSQRLWMFCLMVLTMDGSFVVSSISVNKAASVLFEALFGENMSCRYVSSI